MIEIVLDKNFTIDTFHNQACPVYVLPHFNGKDIFDYLSLAQNIIAYFSDNRVGIIRLKDKRCNRNMLALALFIESCRTETILECAVFKIKDYEQALAEYKPYISLSYAMKLALRLCHQPPADTYHELKNMQYLGLDIHVDYLKNKIYSTLPGSGLPCRFTTHTTSEAIIAAATLKALSLAKSGAHIEFEININNQDTYINQDMIISRIIENVHPWIH